MKIDRHVALVENFSIDFVNFRLSYAKYLETQGYRVTAIIPQDGSENVVERTGLATRTYSLKKNSLNLFNFIKNMRSFRKIQREEGIDLVHSFRLQPNIAACLAFAFSGKTTVIAHITGLGYAFSSHSLRSLFYRIVISFLYQISLLFAQKIVVQNKTDFMLLSRLLFISPKLILIESSGIDCLKFSRENLDTQVIGNLKKKLEYIDGQKVVTFTGRLLREKGILEFLEAAERISENNIGIRFVVAGWFDKNNPSCISQDIIEKYQRKEIINYLGMIEEIKELLSITNVFVLPTYREGFPRSVLEAMSMGVPVITTNVPGASDAVFHEKNGLLVEPRDIDSLIIAILYLINNEEIAVSMGDHGRRRVEEEYKNEIVYKKFMELYMTS